MFQFNYKLKVAERAKAKCERHPRYNPEREGRGGIKGGCSTCFSLFDLHQARLSLDAAHREFLRRATPWSHVRQPRNRTNAQEQKNLRLEANLSNPMGCICNPTLCKKMPPMVSKSAPLISLRKVDGMNFAHARRAAGPFRGCYETFWSYEV
jgi:hypothetical protein